MIGFWEVVRRSESGPLVKEKDFDMQVGMLARQMVEKHGIKYDPQQVIPADDDLADRVYRAGLSTGSGLTLRPVQSATLPADIGRERSLVALGQDGDT